MADILLTNVAIPSVTPAGADTVLLWDASAAANGKCTITELITLLTSTFATLVGANVFTDSQSIAGALAAQRVILANRAAGAGSRGGYVYVGQNSDDATPGTLELVCNAASGGSNVFVWSDDSGNLRAKRGFSTNWPTGANRNTDGVVVGTQTSSLDRKHIIGAELEGDSALAHVADGAAAVRRFAYKDGSFGGEEFEGVVVDYAPRYGMDRDERHPAGKSLNTITAIGDLLRAVDYLAGQVATLQAQVAALQTA